MAGWSKFMVRIVRQDHACAAHHCGSAEKGGICAFVDAEHALDPIYARKLGVNVDDLLISQPDAGEQALEIADTLVRSGAIDVLVVASFRTLFPAPCLVLPEGDPGREGVNCVCVWLHARITSLQQRFRSSRPFERIRGK